MNWTKTLVMLGAVSAPLTAMAQQEVAPPAATPSVQVSVSVTGQFLKPGRYIFPPKTPLLDAIAAAGGLNIAPSKAQLFVLRRGKAINFNPVALLESRSKPFELENEDVLVAIALFPTRPRPVVLPQLDNARKSAPRGKSFLFNGRKVWVTPLKK